MSERDTLLSDFVAQTGTDPGFARDLLAAADWNYDTALKGYAAMAGSPSSPVNVHVRTGRDRNQTSEDSQALPNLSGRDLFRSDRTMSILNKSLVMDINERRSHESGSHSPNTSEYRQGLEAALVAPTPGSQFTDMTMILPDLQALPTHFREFIEEDLLDNCMRRSLETSGWSL